MQKIQPSKKKKKKKNIPYLGPNLLYYCYECSLPLISSNNCPICDNQVKLVSLTPPYDVRPGTPYEVAEIIELIKTTFGNNTSIIHKDDILLLNHIGSEDHLDEIILYGKSIGTRRYDITSNNWILKLNAHGLALLNGKDIIKWVMIDDGAIDYIIKGASVLIPGIIDADENIKVGNYIVIIDKNHKVVAGGIARINDSERNEMKKGVYAKTYQAADEYVEEHHTKRSWKDIVKWNEKELVRLEKKAISFIHKIKDDLELPVMVSYSGGKDSLVTLSLVMQASPDRDFDVLFVDTGIEFPETVSYVEESSKQLGFDDKLTIERVSSEVFWNAFEKFGPPGRDFRHCCKFAKLAPIQRSIDKLYQGGQCVSFVGQRRYESFKRAVTDIWQNQYVSNQINVSPIQNWNALMIWMYIFWRELPYNQLYDRGYERIGCWVCPSSDMAQFKILEMNHPKLYSRLYTAVEDWRARKNLPKSFWKYGLWRFKQIPKKISSVLSLDLEDFKVSSENNELSFLEIEVTDCISYRITAIGSFSNRINLDTVSSALLMIGKVQFNRKLSFIRVSNKRFSIILYHDSSFKIVFKKHDNLTRNFIQNVIENFIHTVFRAIECINCELCVGKCKLKAITINNNIIFVDQTKCTKCKLCSEACPIVTIVHRKVKGTIKQTLTENNLLQISS